MVVWRSSDSYSSTDKISAFHLSSDQCPVALRRSNPGNWMLPYSSKWRQDLEAKLVEIGLADFREALLLDVIGVEVRPFNNSADISPDRFPLRILILRRHVRSTSKSSTSSRLSATPSGADVDVVCRNPPLTTDVDVLSRHQISDEIAFEDVWPGIVDLKLNQQGPTMPGPILVTDVMGAKLDVYSDSSMPAPLPAPYRFPLMLFFRTPRVGVQSMPANTLSSGQAVLMERSLELPLTDILRDVVEGKLLAMGVPMSAKARPFVLITDPTGVVVKVEEGIPDRSRFPLRFYLDAAALRDVCESSGSQDNVRHHRWLSGGAKDVNQALHGKLSFFRKCFRLGFSNLHRQQQQH